MSQVSLRSRITIDDRSKIGKYTCMAHDEQGNSGSAVLTMQESAGYNPQPVYPGPSYPEYGPGPAPAPAPARKLDKQGNIVSRIKWDFLASGGQGYLRIVAPDMTEGDYVEIQCEGAAPEDEGRIQWYFKNQVCNPILSRFDDKNQSIPKKVDLI